MIGVAIVGSRKESAARKQEVLRIVKSLRPGHVVITGDAAGVDTYAHEAALKHGLVSVRCHAPWCVGRQAGPLRNSVIADIADTCYALPDADGSPGTWNCISQFRALGKLVEVIEL